MHAALEHSQRGKLKAQGADYGDWAFPKLNQKAVYVADVASVLQPES